MDLTADSLRNGVGMCSRIAALVLVSSFVALSGCGAPARETRTEGEAIETRAPAGTDEPRRLRESGLTAELPAAWDGSIEEQASGVPFLRAATFPLPPPVSDPLRELTTDRALDLIGKEDAYIVLVDVTVPIPEDRGWVEVGSTISIDRTHLIDVGHLRPPAPASHSLARRFLIVNERVLILFVWFGAASPSDATLAEANRVLATVSAGPWRPEECPPSWPGPWTACPEANWVGRVTETAGYRIVGDTGSALVAQGRGRSFTIWATQPEEPIRRIAERENWSPLGTVDGVQVYGDESQWHWWVAQGSIFWMSTDPHRGGRLPDLGEMASLVRASRDLPPPE